MSKFHTYWEIGRKVDITFVNQGKETKVVEIFDAESTHSIEMQQAGWQAIMDNFKRYTKDNLSSEVIEMALTSTHIFVNLHVKNVKQSMAFFTGLGFEFNMQFTDEEKTACLVIGDNMFAMLLTEEYFKSFTKKEVVDTDKYAQLTLALSAESREKVDEIVNTAVSLGGKLYTDPADYGFMYQWGFQDTVGHIWEIAHMNMNAFEGPGQA